MSRSNRGLREEFERLYETLSPELLTQIGFPSSQHIPVLVGPFPVPETLKEAFEPWARAVNAVYPNALSEECIFRHVLTAVLNLRRIYQQPNRSVIDQEFEAMLREIEDEIQDYTAITPIENLKVEVPEFKIADVTLVSRTVPSDSRLATFLSLFEGTMTEYAQDFEYVHSFAVVPVRAQWEKAKIIAIGKVKDVLNVFRLFIGSGEAQGVQLFRQVRLIGETGISSGRYVYLTCQYDDGASGIGGITPPSHGMTTVIIRQDFLNLLKVSGLPYIEKVLQDKDQDDFKRKVYRAVTWFGRGICASTDDEKFTSYMVALETLLIHKEDSKRATLAKRVAALLANNPPEYEQFKKYTKELYDLRSAIVHGGKPAERVPGFEILTRQVMHRFIMRGFATFDEFTEWIESQKSKLETQPPECQNTKCH